MTEQEQIDLAERLAEGSDIFDFERALEVVRRRPADAEEIVRDREEWRQLMGEISRANKRVLLAAREL